MPIVPGCSKLRLAAFLTFHLGHTPYSGSKVPCRFLSLDTLWRTHFRPYRGTSWPGWLGQFVFRRLYGSVARSHGIELQFDISRWEYINSCEFMKFAKIQNRTFVWTVTRNVYRRKEKSWKESTVAPGVAFWKASVQTNARDEPRINTTRSHVPHIPLASTHESQILTRFALHWHLFQIIEVFSFRIGYNSELETFKKKFKTQNNNFVRTIEKKT